MKRVARVRRDGFRPPLDELQEAVDLLPQQEPPLPPEWPTDEVDPRLMDPAD